MVEPSLVIGATGFAIGAVQASISVLKFIRQVVTDAKGFGDDVPTLGTRLTCETARLQYFERYLKEKADGTTPKLETLPSLVQSAVIGLIQELKIQFAAYSNLVAEHKLEDLQREHAESFEQSLDDLVEKRKGEVDSINDKAIIAGRLKWGLFQKKRVVRLLTIIEEWNDRLMNLLLCGSCFGPASPTAAPADSTEVNGPCFSGVLSLRALIKAQDQTNSPARRDRISEPGLRLELPTPGAKVGTLVRSSAAGTANDSSAERTRVFVEVKTFALRRRALEPSKEVKQRVNRLADLLAHAAGPEAGFRTLQCIAVVRVSSPATGYAFAFNLPEEKFGTETDDPYTLLRALEQRRVGGDANDGRRRPTLGERFAMARALAQTMFELHSINWVHKSIRSENVLLPWRRPSQGSEVVTECDYARPILVGFEFAREEGDISTQEQDSQPYRNVYRHPDRQGPPDVRFAARHDAYALGVVLLEIGLWQPAIKLDARFLEREMEAENVMQALRDRARIRLPHYMGVDYAEAVMACLRGQPLAAEEGGEGGQSTGSKTGDVEEEQRMRNNMAFLELVVEKISKGIVLREQRVRRE